MFSFEKIIRTYLMIKAEEIAALAKDYGITLTDAATDRSIVTQKVPPQSSSRE
jgi:hypothetical protein